ncbi:hydroxypyruvate isomerase [Planctomycetales bacterium]|nr:hydroxypyruvate isomerase [Planctomycetales bacterium]
MTNRRNFLKTVSLGAGALLFGNAIVAQEAADGIKQSVAYGPFRSTFPIADFAKICKEIGFVGIDLVNPDEWETVTKAGLIVTLSRAPGTSMGESFNHLEYHDKTEAVYADLLPLAKKANVKNVICFSGNRKGISDEEGLENSVKGLKRVLPIAEQNGVTLIMELLNSVGHKDYHADHTAWGAELARRLGSENFKLLYDIYHMQVMEGNLIDTIRKNKDVIGHYHTAGCPGRADIDENQEINYAAVVRAINETGFKGYLAHEFSPKKKAPEDKIESLRYAFNVCKNK